MDSNITICKNCKINQPNHGRALCQPCVEKLPRVCNSCKINQSNPGRALCQSCFLDQKIQTIDEFINEACRIKKFISGGKCESLVSIPSTLRHEVWKKYISDVYRKGKCFCCRSSIIEESNFECGHIISRKNGGPINLDNLRPICSQCNKSMGTRQMDDFIILCGFWKDTIKMAPKNEQDAVKLAKTTDELFIKQIDRSWCDISKQIGICITHTRDYGNTYKWTCCGSAAKYPEYHGKPSVDLDLNLFKVTQLRQLCMLFELSSYGTKPKMIAKILKNHTLIDIQLKIDAVKNKKYLVKCNSKDLFHTYMTDIKLYADKDQMINGHYIGSKNSKCEICDEKSYMAIYNNEFLSS